MIGWLPVALTGYFLVSLVALLDKFLLSEKLKPWQYAVYGGFFGIAGLVLIPFGFELPGTAAVVWAALSGVLFIVALYPLYVLVNRTEITRASPLVGALVPIFTFLGAALILKESLNRLELVAFLFLVAGGFLIIFRRAFIRESLQNLALALAAAILFGVSFVAVKASFLAGANFISGFVIARLGSFFFVLFVFLIFYRWIVPSLRGGPARPREQIIWVGINKALSGLGFLVLNYAIFLGSVSVVQAMQGVQYVFLLILGGVGGLFIKSLRERYSAGIVILKLIAVGLITIGLLLAVLSERPAGNPGLVLRYGVSFSTVYTERLQLDYQKVFRALTDDLGVKHFRLITYWPEIEPEKDNYDFQKLDWLMGEVERRGGSVILVIGQKVPRFPECHIPGWAYDSETVRKQELLDLIEVVVNHYKDRPVIQAWQVENEPFLPTTPNLGKCPKLDRDLLDREIALVRSLDDRPVIVTDSGELGRWLAAYKRADIFGTTLYRVVYIGGLGYLHHLSSPEFYFVKENLAKFLHGTKKVITIELQAEPWGPEQTYNLPVEERRKSMDIEQLRQNIDFAKAVGHPEVYLWGAEWWYWEREQGYGEFWEEAKALFAP